MVVGLVYYGNSVVEFIMIEYVWFCLAIDLFVVAVYCVCLLCN